MPAESTILERGDVFFFYRPRVEADDVDDLDEVQRFLVILKPDGRGLYRLIVIGRKRLPVTEQHERAWAFVAKVSEDPDELRAELEPAQYETKTRSTRVEPAARAAGEGRYALVAHDGHTHLAYTLELPPTSGAVQRELNIEQAASYIVSAKNPDAPAPPGRGLAQHRKAALPEELRKRFGNRRFVAVEPPDLLDHEGLELVLIGASADIAGELGIELDAERERLETADLLEQLRLQPEQLPTDPTRSGEWR
jgi:hypothetical protein